MSPLLLPVLEIGKSLIERFVPNAEARRAAEAEFLKMAMEGELRTVIAQLEINAKEAASPRFWVSGWRPFFGWVGGCGFAYISILQPVFAWYGASHGWVAPPEVNTELLWTVITGLLGLGGYRTLEKVQGVTK